jgi:8-oxo-dGTP pyrophosphatase MutT (NUDIX family)
MCYTMDATGAGILYLVMTDRLSDRHIILGLSTLNNVWEIPGGSIESKDKSIVHTAVRESFEEFGIDSKHFDEMVRHILSNTNVVYVRNGIHKYNLYVVGIKEFNIEQANIAATKRLNEYAAKGGSHAHVEMSRYDKVNLWSWIHNKTTDKNIRDRDLSLLNRADLITMLLKVSSDAYTFSNGFEFNNNLNLN